MIYKVIKKIFRLAVSLFFKDIQVAGQENIPKTGPLILVANHPNTLLDPILVGLVTQQQVGFVAMASLFENKILASVLTYLHVLPVVRKQDIKPGEKADNLTTFRKSHQYLRKGNTLAIFPEGASFYEMRLQELKTGTARIALSFEKEENYQGNLKIIPIALDYSDSIQFRSSISITINKGIEVAKYAQEYEQDNQSAIRSLTEEIRLNLAEYIPQTEGKEQEDLLIQIHSFYTNVIDESTNLDLDVKRSLSTRNELAQKVKVLQEKEVLKYDELKLLSNRLYFLLDKYAITPGFLSNRFTRKNLKNHQLNYVIKLIVLFPFYIYGLIFNYIPYSLPLKVFKALKLKIEYKTSVELVVGLLVFPLFYFLETWWFKFAISQNGWLVLLFLFSLPISGYIAMYYWSNLKRFLRLRRFKKLPNEQQVELHELTSKLTNSLKEL